MAICRGVESSLEEMLAFGGSAGDWGIPLRRFRCQRAVISFLCAAQSLEASIYLPPEVAEMVAKSLWASRADAVWDQEKTTTSLPPKIEIQKAKTVVVEPPRQRSLLDAVVSWWNDILEA